MMLKDPLARRFISGSCFAGAFVWVAVRYFNVDTEVVWVFFLMSFVIVGCMMAAAFLIAPLLRLFRHKPTMLSNIAKAESELEQALEEEPTDSQASKGG